jgi:hypothetical protein
VAEHSGAAGHRRRSHRERPRLARSRRAPHRQDTLVAGLTGALTVTAAWAGVGLVPVPVPTEQSVEESVTADPSSLLAQLPGTAEQSESSPVPADGPPPLAEGQLLVGATKTSLLPRPQDMQVEFPGAR